MLLELPFITFLFFNYLYGSCYTLLHYVMFQKMLYENYKHAIKLDTFTLCLFKLLCSTYTIGRRSGGIGSCSSLLFQHGPVKHIVILNTNEKILTTLKLWQKGQIKLSQLQYDKHGMLWYLKGIFYERKIKSNER